MPRGAPVLTRPLRHLYCRSLWPPGTVPVGTNFPLAPASTVRHTPGVVAIGSLTVTCCLNHERAHPSRGGAAKPPGLTESAGLPNGEAA
jgi:hypothetical protein